MEYGSGSAPPATPQRVVRGDGPGHAHLKRPLVNPLKLRTDAAAYPNGAWHTREPLRLRGR